MDEAVNIKEPSGLYSVAPPRIKSLDPTGKMPLNFFQILYMIYVGFHQSQFIAVYYRLVSFSQSFVLLRNNHLQDLQTWFTMNTITIC